MTNAILSYGNRFLVTGTQEATFTGDSNFSAAPPASNLGNAQLPRVAEFSGAAATLTCEAVDGSNPDTFSADVFALLGLQGFADSAVIDFYDGSTLLGSVTYSAPPVGGEHAVLTLDSPASLDTLTVEISSAGTGTKRIGAVWAGTSKRFDQGNETAIETSDTGIVSRSQGGTAWTFGGETVNSFAIRARESSPESWYAALKAVGTTEPVLFILDRNGSRFIVSYGLIEQGWQIRPISSSLYDVSARLVESL
jgi:hypothetical protein